VLTAEATFFLSFFLQAGRKRNYLLVYGPKPYCVVGYEVVASSRPDGLEIKDCL